MIKGANVYNHKLLNKGIIIIGSESHGISKDLQELIDEIISIPSYNENNHSAESLNAAVATGLVLAEFRRSKGLDQL